MVDGVPSHIDDWGDVCEFIAMDFSNIINSLGQTLQQYGDHLSKEVREKLEKGLEIANDGRQQVSFVDGVPEVTGKGRELAGKLYDILGEARQVSVEQLNKTAGIAE